MRKRVKKLDKSYRNILSNLPNAGNFHYTGSVTEMKKRYYGEEALLVRCGSFIYNVTAYPEYYDKAR